KIVLGVPRQPGLDRGRVARVLGPSVWKRGVGGPGRGSEHQAGDRVRDESERERATDAREPRESFGREADGRALQRRPARRLRLHEPGKKYSPAIIVLALWLTTLPIRS